MGHMPSLFWELSISEVYDLIESYNRLQKNKAEEEKQRLKTTIILNSTLARQIGENVAVLFSQDAKITELHTLFPKLFPKINDSINEVNLYKAKMEEFAYRHNLRLRKE